MSGLFPLSRFGRFLLILMIGSFALGLVSMAPTGKQAVRPRAPHPVADVLQLEGNADGRLNGELDMVEVEQFDLTLGQRIVLSFDESTTISSTPDDRDRDRDEKVDAALMNESKQYAAVVAFRALGRTVRITGRGAQVQEVATDGPAHGLLRAGDIIVSVAGKPARTASEVSAMVAATRPGRTVRLGLRRDNRDVEVVVPTVAAKLSGRDARIGIAISTVRLNVRLPEKVRIDTGETGGPSAGLAFALTIYDAYSPRDVLRGRHVVATGQLTLDGDVLEIGGARQKAWSAARAGADLLLVPKANLQRASDSAREACGDQDRCVRVVGVESFEQALKELDRA